MSTAAEIVSVSDAGGAGCGGGGDCNWGGGSAFGFQWLLILEGRMACYLFMKCRALRGFIIYVSAIYFKLEVLLFIFFFWGNFKLEVQSVLVSQIKVTVVLSVWNFMS